MTTKIIKSIKLENLHKLFKHYAGQNHSSRLIVLQVVESLRDGLEKIKVEAVYGRLIQGHRCDSCLIVNVHEN